MNAHQLRVACLGLLWFFAGGGVRAWGFGPAANDTPPPEHLPADLHTYPNPNNYGKLEGGGKLVSQDLDPHWLYTDTYFARDRQHGVMLQHNLRAINVFLAAEIRRPKTVQTFLKEYLLLFLETTLANDGALPLTPESEWGTGLYGPPHYPTTAKQARLLAKVRSYELPAGPTLAGNTWTVDANMLTDHGALDHWLVRGSIRPLRINSFLCEPREPEGTFYPPMHFQ